MIIIVIILIITNILMMLKIFKDKEQIEEMGDKILQYVGKLDELSEKNEDMKKELEFADSTNEGMYTILKEEEPEKDQAGNKSFEAFYEKVNDEIERKKRHDILKFAVLGIFIDFYAEYKDMYGEEAILNIRKIVMETAGKNLRKIDFMAKAKECDGVMLLLPLTSIDGAVVVAKRVQNRLKEQEIEVEGKKIITTLTIAVCEVEKNGDFKTIESIISKLKKDGKESGGNTIVVEKI